MVCLNNKLPIDVKSMKRIILKELDIILENNLWYLEDVKDERKDKLKKDIVKEMKKNINSDNFLYLIIHNDHCTFKHQRGKKDGNFCCKNITVNGNKDKYVCTQHNRNYIPQKRQINTSSNNILISKSINLIDNNNLTNESIKDILQKSELENNNTNIKVLSSEDTSSISNSNGIKKYKNNHIIKNKIKKINLYNNFNLNYFKKNIKYNDQYNSSENIICKYNKIGRAHV